MAVTSNDERLWNTVHVISADWFEHIYFRKQYSWLLQYCYIHKRRIRTKAIYVAYLVLLLILLDT